MCISGLITKDERMSESSLLSMFVSLNITPSKLRDVCQCSLDIVDNASSHQINAAVKHNQNEINKLLIQLLTVNYISKNEQTIDNEIKNLKLDNENTNNSNSKQLTNYCNQKLLEISPIHGFSPKRYLVEYKISDDVRMEILTYLKPIQLFKSISRVNKQFNKNVKTMHESTNSKYMSLFDTSNFTFNSFLEIEEYYNNSKRKSLYNGQIYVDWRHSNGFFYYGPVTGINTFSQCISARALGNNPTSRSGIVWWEAAPYHNVAYRPCNKNRFKNTIIKRGYYNETCDINISKFGETVVNNEKSTYEWFHIKHGFVDLSAMTSIPDCWVCGKINFFSTLNNAVFYTCHRNGVSITDVDDIYNPKKYHRIKDSLEKSFNLCQIFIDVDITQYYDKYSAVEIAAIHAKFPIHVETRNGRKIVSVSLVVHGDDRCNFSFFGDKSSIEDRKKITMSGFCNGKVNKAKQKFLDLIGYPNYFTLAPSGCICRLDDDKKFNFWCNRWKQCDCSATLYSAGTMKRGIDKDILNKIHYDEEKDELVITKLYTNAVIMVIDSDVPAPLKNTYLLTIGCPQRPRLVDGVIIEPALTDISCDELNEFESTDHCEKKIDTRKIYFDRLEKWQGYLRFTFDVTDVFDEFQERLKDEWNTYKNRCNVNDGVNEWPGNRKYFTNLNTNDMALNLVKWDRERNRILCDDFIRPQPDESNFIVKHDFSLNIVDRLGRMRTKILSNILSYACPNDLCCFTRVCQEWNNLLSDN